MVKLNWIWRDNEPEHIPGDELLLQSCLFFSNDVGLQVDCCPFSWDHPDHFTLPVCPVHLVNDSMTVKWIPHTKDPLLFTCRETRRFRPPRNSLQRLAEFLPEKIARTICQQEETSIFAFEKTPRSGNQSSYDVVIVVVVFFLNIFFVWKQNDRTTAVWTGCSCYPGL